MNILFISDVVGSPGRRAVSILLSKLKEKLKVNLTIANCENVAGGMGLTEDTCNQLFKSGVDFLTSGNHHWDKKGIDDYMAKENRLIRPANFPSTEEYPCPGKGFGIVAGNDGCRVGVINLQGRVFMPPLDCPFQVADRIIAEIQKETKVIVVDMHAEATSEKRAMGFYLDGRVSLVVGTHTHVQTADEQILSKGTAYITDVGMTGPHDSVIGIENKLILQRLLTSRPLKYEVAIGGVKLNAVLVDVDPKTGRAKSIKRIVEALED